MDSLFLWIEGTALSMWIGQSATVFAFPAILVVHTLGMAMLAGISVMVDLRLLGFASQIPSVRLARFWPLFWKLYQEHREPGNPPRLPPF